MTDLYGPITEHPEFSIEDPRRFTVAIKGHFFEGPDDSRCEACGFPKGEVMHEPSPDLPWTIDRIKAANEAAGQFFFSKATLRHFNSLALASTWTGHLESFLVVSDKDPSSPGFAREYFVCRFEHATARVSYLSPKAGFSSPAKAYEAAREAAVRSKEGAKA